METKRTTVEAAEQILDRYFPVHDHGFVSLVDYMGTDTDIETATRVSYGAAGRTTDKTNELIRYLRRHKHTSPSEMVELKFHCCMPIFIARQWIRHRTANVNEQSGRYSVLPMIFYTPTPEHMQTQSKTNKQGQSGDLVSSSVAAEAHAQWELGRAQAAATYEWLNANDMARELARIDLPLSTYTQWYWKIDLHNLLHFLTLRVDSHAQYEIRAYGEVMAGMVKRVAPLSYKAWIDYDVCGARFSRAEMETLRMLVTVAENGNVTNSAAKVTIGTPFLAEALGMGTREIDEFKAKLHPRDVPDFELDLSKAVEGSVFAERFERGKAP